jgi:hypothetical protein
MSIVNFNHLMENRHKTRRCGSQDQECYWVPVGDIRSTHGGNVHMTMVCRRCTKREDIFLTKKEYQIHERIILKEIKHV